MFQSKSPGKPSLQQQHTAQSLDTHSHLSATTSTANAAHDDDDEDEDGMPGALHGSLPPVASALSEKKKKRLAAEAEAREIEASPYGIKRNRRLVASKIELESDVYTQQIKIAKNIYDSDITFSAPAPDSGTWRVTDAYYDKARAIYESIVTPFSAPPKVYKLEAMHQKLRTMAQTETTGKGRRGAGRGARAGLKKSGEDEDTSTATTTLATTSAASKAVVEDAPAAANIDPEQELATMLDPFDVPKPWVIKYDDEGQVYYYNKVTKAKRSDRPQDVWKDKLGRLEVLVPRDDASGWDYKETEAEQRARIRTQVLFEKKVLAEIKRRETQPTPLEMVEDVLAGMVDEVERREHLRVRREETEAYNKVKGTWHPATTGHRMKRLGELPAVEYDPNTGGVVSKLATRRRVTDLDFMEMVVSIHGFGIAKVMPADLLEMFELEREERRDAIVAAEAEAERIRKLPAAEKVRLLVQQARDEGAKAALHAVVDGVRYRAGYIPRKLKALDGHVVLDTTKGIAIQGASSLVKAIRNPKAVVDSVATGASKIYNTLFPKRISAEEELEMLMHEVEEEAEKAQQAIEARTETALEVSKKANRARLHERKQRFPMRGRNGLRSPDEPTVPAKIPDATLVTLTITVKAPPHTIMEHSPIDLALIMSRDALLGRKRIKKPGYEDYESDSDSDASMYTTEPVLIADPPKRSNPSERLKFEAQLLVDLSIAACIPGRYFSIEEVRNLPDDDAKVKELIARNQEYYKIEDEQRKLEEAEALKRAEWEKTEIAKIRAREKEMMKEELDGLFGEMKETLAKLKPNVSFSKTTKTGDVNHPSEAVDGAEDVTIDRNIDIFAENPAADAGASNGGVVVASERSPSALPAIEEGDKEDNIYSPIATQTPIVSEHEIGHETGSEVVAYTGDHLQPGDANEAETAGPPSPSAVKWDPNVVKTESFSWLSRDLQTLSEAEKLRRRIEALQLSAPRALALESKESRAPIEFELRKRALKDRIEWVKMQRKRLATTVARHLNAKVSDLETAVEALAASTVANAANEDADGEDIDAPKPSPDQLTDDFIAREELNSARESIASAVEMEKRLEQEEQLCADDLRSLEVDDPTVRVFARLDGGGMPADDLSDDEDGYRVNISPSQIVGPKAQQSSNNVSSAIVNKSSGPSVPNAAVAAVSSPDLTPSNVDSTGNSSALVVANAPPPALDTTTAAADVAAPITTADSSTALAPWRPLTPGTAKRMKPGSNENGGEEKENDEEAVPQVLHSCEITISIYVDDSLRSRHELLAELASSDIAIMLQQQVFQRASALHAGSLSTNIVDVRYKANIFKQRIFQSWEQRWVYSISPVFFGYLCQKHQKKKEEAKKKTADLKGFRVENPVDYFTPEQKNAYNSLGGDLVKKRAAMGEEAVLNLDIDDIAQELGLKDDSGPKIYRPNMQQLDDREVEKCRRLCKAFEMRFEEVMKYGLIDGKRMSKAQFVAMKNLEQSRRIYKIAVQKLRRDKRIASGEDENEFDDHFYTNIDKDQYAVWQQELKNQETAELRERRIQDELAKEARKELAKQRKNFEMKKYWMINQIKSWVPDKKGFFQMYFKEEVDLALLPNARRSAEQNEYLGEISAAPCLGLGKDVEEELKLTDDLFVMIIKWALRRDVAEAKRQRSQIMASSQSQGAIVASQVNNYSISFADNRGAASGNAVDDDDDMSVWSAKNNKGGNNADRRTGGNGSLEILPERTISFAASDRADSYNFDASRSSKDGESPRSDSNRTGGDVGQNSLMDVSSTGSMQDAYNGMNTLSKFEGNSVEQVAGAYVQPSLFAESEFTSRGNALINEASDPNLAMVVPGGGSDAKTRDANPSYFGEDSYQDSMELINIPDNISRADVIQYIIKIYEANKLASMTKTINGSHFNSSSVQRFDGSSTGNNASSSLTGRRASSISNTSSSSITRRRTGINIASTASKDSLLNGSQSQSQDSMDGADNNAPAIVAEPHVFLEQDFELVKKMKWPEIVGTNMEFQKCLEEFPCENSAVMSKEEVRLFAQLCNLLEPPFVKARVRLKAGTKGSKGAAVAVIENRALAGMGSFSQDSDASGARNEKEKALQAQLDEILQKLGNPQASFSRSDVLAMEGFRRQKNFEAAGVRRMARANAWTQAHQHFFVKMPKMKRYCVVCRKKVVENWVEEFDKAEMLWTDANDGEFHDYLQDAKDEMEPVFEAAAEQEGYRKAEAESKARADDIKEWKATNMERYNKMKAELTSLIPTPPAIEPSEDVEIVRDVLNGITQAVAVFRFNHRFDALDPLSDVPFEQWLVFKEAKMRAKTPRTAGPDQVPAHIKASGLALIDPLGKSILVTETVVVATKDGDEGKDKKKSAVILPVEDINRYYIEETIKRMLKGDEEAKKQIDFLKTKGLDPEPFMPPPEPESDSDSDGDLDETDENGSLTSAARMRRVRKEDKRLKALEDAKVQREDSLDLMDILAAKPTFDLSLYADINNFDKIPHEIMIRVWHREASADTRRGDFLGYIILTSDELRDPPKGIRAMPLLPDESLGIPMGPKNEILQVQGNLSYKLQVTRWDDIKIGENKRGIGAPCQWKFNIVKASKLASVARNVKTSPFCEIYYRGLVIRGNQKEYYSDWLAIGKTACISRSLDPSWATDPNALLELPPEWSPYDIPLRGLKDGPLKGGGWCAVNHLPDAPEGQAVPEGYKSGKRSSILTKLKTNEINARSLSRSLSTAAHASQIEASMSMGSNSNNDDSGISSSSRGGRNSSRNNGGSSDEDEEGGTKKNAPKVTQLTGRSRLRSVASAVGTAKTLSKRAAEFKKELVEQKLGTLEALIIAQEKERVNMASEERRGRLIDAELARIKELPYLEEQRFHEKEFTRMLELLRDPPIMLSRLRFQMATLTSSGGLIVLCEDPASKRQVDVVLLPVLYDEDEAELSGYTGVFLGMPQHRNLLQIVDASVHQVLRFNFNGMAAINQRVAFILTAHQKGETMSDYMRSNWMVMSDNDFKLLIIQVVRGLMHLHKMQILHRNFHPDCVSVYDPQDPQYSATINAGNSILPSAKLALPIFEDLSKQSAFGSILALNHNDSEFGGGEDSGVLDENGNLNGRSGITAANRPRSGMQDTSNFAEAYRSSDPINAKRPVCEIGDYWFLSNARKPGCEYSQGRADWGHRHTMPPEVVHGGGKQSAGITDRSDIWALGVCIYHWATAGQYPDVGIESKSAPVDLGKIVKNLPLKWGPWLHGVIQMCLQRQPSHRTSSDELYKFLAVARAGHSNTT